MFLFQKHHEIEPIKYTLQIMKHYFPHIEAWYCNSKIDYIEGYESNHNSSYTSTESILLSVVFPTLSIEERKYRR